MQKDQNNFDPARGTIYSVALPIGNPQDISDRSRRCLEDCDIIAAEDTRVFQQLAKELKITFKKVLSYHDHSERDVSEKLIQAVKDGQNLALVSDAGTPQISDPGHHLLRKAFENSISVVPIPGASSITCALSVCPIGGKSFTFAGFASSDDMTLRKEISQHCFHSDRTIFFESPHRIRRHLEISADFLQDRPLFIAREMTKTYEEFVYKPARELLEYFEKPKGEFVIIYPKLPAQQLSLEEIKNEIQELIENNLKPKEILEKISPLTNLARRELYDLITDIKHIIKSKK